MTRLNVVYQGCCHGELDAIYDAIDQQFAPDKTIDLLLIGGDFQAVRLEQDLNCMSVPLKYRQLGDFHLYYSGQKRAPYLTIIIGGNHEASNYFQELYYGGWVAPNIYYLGAAGVVTYRGLKIGGLSGIYDRQDYTLPHFEKVPYDRGTVRSVYHIRELEVIKLLLLNRGEGYKRMDVLMSHDWPQGIERYGDLRWLLQVKKHFKKDVDLRQLGSYPAWQLLTKLRPVYHLSAHLHVRYTATVDHSNSGQITNTDEIELDLDELDPPETKKIKLDNGKTNFLALDKCLPRRKFVELLEFVVDDQGSEAPLSYDQDWLAITRAMNDYHHSDTKSDFPDEVITAIKAKVDKELEWVEKNVRNLAIPNNFKSYLTELESQDKNQQPREIRNNQTQEFCNLIGI